MNNLLITSKISCVVFEDAKKKSNGLIALSNIIDASYTGFFYMEKKQKAMSLNKFLLITKYLGKDHVMNLIGDLLESMTLNPSNFNTKIVKKVDSRLKIRQKRIGTKKNDSFKGNDDESAKTQPIPRTSKNNRCSDKRA